MKTFLIKIKNNIIILNENNTVIFDKTYKNETIYQKFKDLSNITQISCDNFCSSEIGTMWI